LRIPWVSVLRLDLHSHSNRSDGALAPRELVRRAAGNGVRALALTDHDDTSGLDEAAHAASELGVRLVPGVEISVTWSGGLTVHVLGLGIAASDATLAGGLARLRAGRDARARAIAERLERMGIPGAYEGAIAEAGGTAAPSRTHFARFLVAGGHARDLKTAFRRILGSGCPGYVAHRWVDLGEAVGWIRAAGGVAVLAHPGRYGLRSARMTTLLTEFRTAGGEAIEVVTGNHTPEQAREFSRLAFAHGFAASAGSDFHSPAESWMDVGRLSGLPEGCAPVWERWPEIAAAASA